MKRFKINAFRHWRIIFSMCFFILSIFVLVDVRSNDSNLIIAFFLLLIVSLPGLYLHLRYYLENKNCLLQYEKNSFEFIKDKTVLKFSKQDIKEVRHHTNRIQHRAPWAMYEFVEIILNEGRSIKVTVLMADPDELMHQCKLDHKRFPRYLCTFHSVLLD